MANRCIGFFLLGLAGGVAKADDNEQPHQKDLHGISSQFISLDFC
jgi:hypothetical protein